MFMIYSIFLMLIPYKRDFDYIIIHGAGLSQGEKLTKLLAERVNKAMLVYRKDPTPPYLIPSGGRGNDEKKHAVMLVAVLIPTLTAVIIPLMLYYR